MIDLHIHSSYSDGSDSVVDILKNAESIGLEIISITDHDTCLAYDEIEKMDYKDYFSGRIVKGCEITTSYKGVRIEILAYNMTNHSNITDYLAPFICDSNWDGVTEGIRLDLLSKFDSLGIMYDLEFLESHMLRDLEKFETCIYENILELNSEHYLKKVLSSNYCATGQEFFRRCTSQVNNYFCTPYYLNNPSLSEVIDLVHDNGGLCFLAHPFYYKINGLFEFMTDLYKEYNIDGIECYHYSFSKRNTEFLIDFAMTNELLICGGSDYHGTKRPGVLMGCSEVPRDIL